MKIKILIALIIGINVFSQVGINTQQPTKTLDINGDLRVRNLEKKSADPNYNKVLVTNANGDIEFWDKAAIQTEMKGTEVENKIMYFSSSPSGDLVVPCGKFKLRYSSNTEPQIQLVTAPTSTQTIFFSRIRKVNSSDNTFGAANSKRSIRTNETVSIATNNNWVNIGSVSNLTDANGGKYAVDYLDEYYMSFPGENYLYRITFLARKMATTPAANSYSMLCEKF